MSEPSEFDKRRRSIFGGEAQAYADGRPGYPNDVFDQLERDHALGPGCTVLEIGPGAGQATAGLLDAGADVTAVEISPEFCEMLRLSFRNRRLQVVQGEFEAADLPVESFDLVVAATSFHWIDPVVGLPRVADLLRPGGTLALWWTHYGDVARPDPFRVALQPLLRRHVPQFADDVDGGVAIGAHPYALDVETRRREFAATGRFGALEHRVFAWSVEQSARQTRRFFSSFSQWMALDPDVREPLLDAIEDLVADDFGGAVERPVLTALYTARRS